MQRSLLFWVIMILWLLFGCFVFWPHGGGGAVAFFPIGNQFLQWFLFGLLGWQVYGPALK